MAVSHARGDRVTPIVNPAAREPQRRKKSLPRVGFGPGGLGVRVDPDIPDPRRRAVQLNANQVKAMRDCASYLLETSLPYKTGDDTYKVICRDYGGHPGTTCGFLCHWLMWRLGVTNQNLSTI